MNALLAKMSEQIASWRKGEEVVIVSSDKEQYITSRRPSLQAMQDYESRASLHTGDEGGSWHKSLPLWRDSDEHLAVAVSRSYALLALSSQSGS